MKLNTILAVPPTSLTSTATTGCVVVPSQVNETAAVFEPVSSMPSVWVACTKKLRFTVLAGPGLYLVEPRPGATPGLRVR